MNWKMTNSPASLRSKTALMVKGIDYESKVRNVGRKLRDAPAWTGSLTAMLDGSGGLQDCRECGYFALFSRHPVVHGLLRCLIHLFRGHQYMRPQMYCPTLVDC